MQNHFLIELDEEWVLLMKEAKAAGLTVEEIRDFLITDNPKTFFLPKCSK